MPQLVIFGAGDIARLACHYFESDSDFDVAAFAVDAAYRESDTYLGRPLVDFETVLDAYPPSTYTFFVAVSYAGMNTLRARKCAEAKRKGYRLATYVSSRCTYLSAELPGENCFILEDNTIQPFVQIGDDITLWSGNHIGHDSIIEDHCFISSHVVISGHVRVGPFCFIGVNATVRNSIVLAPRTLVGAGGLVMKDTVEGGVYVSPPARLIGTNSDEVEI